MAKSAITLSPAMGPLIIKHLRQFGDLPSSGVLAGQAVDSAITDLFGNGGGVYNDVDIFRAVPSSPARRARSYATSMSGRSNLTAYVPRDSSYSQMGWQLALIRNYGLKSVSRKGMINFVNCVPADFRKPLTPLRIISGFDLNCTRVAVNLQSEQLIWDDHYAEFLRSRQLRIAMMHTPWHTFLRLAKKLKELPDVYANLEFAAEVCTSVANSPVIAGLRQSNEISLLFGSKHHELAQAASDIWTPYFTLKAHTFERRNRTWQELNYVSGSHSEEDSTNGFVLTNLRTASKAPEESTTLWSMTCRGSLSSQIQQRCNLAGRGILFFASKIIEESHRATSKATVAKLAALHVDENPVMQSFSDWNATLFKADYVQGQALPTIAQKVNNWLKKHTGFAGRFLGLTLAEQYQCINDINTVTQEFSRLFNISDSMYALGVLESQATRWDLTSHDTMFTLIKADYELNRKPFSVQPLCLPDPQDIPEKFKEFRVTELLSPVELSVEGSAMHHCVGGYSFKIRDNRSRIISIKHDKLTSLNCSTVELGLSRKELMVYVIQNRAKCNKSPSSLNNEFVEFLTQFISDNLTESHLKLQAA